MTTSSIREIWKLLEKYKKETKLLKNKEALILLIYISRHQGIKLSGLKGKVEKLLPQFDTLMDFLIANKFIELKEEVLSLSEKGKDIVKTVKYSQYDISNLPPKIINGYTLMKSLGKGSTSVTYKANIKKTGRDVVLKVFKPGILDHINFEEKIKKIIHLKSSHLVVPFDWGEFPYTDINLKYVVMEYVEGDSLREFLAKNTNMALQETLRNFIREVGGALKTIKDNGFMHGDLHDNNILVEDDEIEEYQKRGIFHFRLIDFIGVNSSGEFREYEKTDFEYFKENFLKIIRKYCLTPSGKIDRKKLEERLFYIYGNLIQNKYTSIEAVINGLSEKIPSGEKLSIEQPFNYLIFENYDVKELLWLERFEPELRLYSNFINFGPLICSGPRGGGKTIYLRSLSFIPRLIKLAQKPQYIKIKNKVAYFKGIFGIYFPCRQGEFKYFSDKQYNFKEFKNQLFLKHILILKIIRRTVSLIAEAYNEEIFTSEPKPELILNFLSDYLLLKEIRMTISAREKPFKELTSILRNEENCCIDILGDIPKYPSESKLLNENILIQFFKTVKKSVSELLDKRFYIIFDDVSEPQVNLEVQKILNCLMACHNEIYCCKFSTDKYAYTFEDMFGKALQLPHDYAYIDMSEMDNYKEYLKKIINRQLEIGGYAKKIKEYLKKLPYTHEKLIDFLSKKTYTKTKYGGWKLLVQLSSWSVRDGLAICESIFKQYGDPQKHEKLKKGEDIISIEIQDKGIRKYSEEVYASLINIESIGKEIFDVVRNFGEISRKYLEREITKKKGRKYEMITIERKDSEKLSGNAEKLLGKLIRHSVFLDKGFSFSREQMGLVQKFTLHKKYTPKLRTTFREREHLRLIKKQLEEFLTEPDRFRKRLIEKGIKDDSQPMLFDFKRGNKNDTGV
ncbi:protein kinase [candidate division WOR-3 bacterium]|nr:protein kinase [candidate division WOR-3 bacterium]